MKNRIIIMSSYCIITLITTGCFYCLTKNILYSILNSQLLLIQMFIIIMTVYNVIVSYLGTFIKRNIKKVDKITTKFAILVAAHNEETVIGNLIISLNNLDYPKELYDIYVICDNCNDNTAKIAKEKNALVFIRENKEKRGKGHAVEWMLENLYSMEKKGKVYDAIAVFDADNIVEKNFLLEMNQKIYEGYEVIQGYLDSKNPDDTWVTRSYSYSFWTTNRIYQLSRYNLGLSAQLGGTGVVIRLSVLKEIGWCSYSLTEDLEFTQRYIIEKNKPIGWSHYSITYDEKPLNVAPSISQRIRWKSGRFSCAFNYFIPLLISTFKNKSLIPFDSLIYLVCPSRFFIFSALGLMSILSVIQKMSIHIEFINKLFIFNVYTYIFLILAYFSLPAYALALEGKSRHIPKLFLGYIFSITSIPVSIMGFLKRNSSKWSHTKHDRNID